MKDGHKWFVTEGLGQIELSWKGFPLSEFRSKGPTEFFLWDERVQRTTRTNSALKQKFAWLQRTFKQNSLAFQTSEQKMVHLSSSCQRLLRIMDHILSVQKGDMDFHKSRNQFLTAREPGLLKITVFVLIE